jgi:hypothetical protein
MARGKSAASGDDHRVCARGIDDAPEAGPSVGQNERAWRHDPLDEALHTFALETGDAAGLQFLRPAVAIGLNGNDDRLFARAADLPNFFGPRLG